MITKYQPLTDMERFELVQAMFPGEFDDDADIGDEEAVIYDQFDMEPEKFDELVGRLVMMAPVMQSPLSGTARHVLGEVTISNGHCHMMAIVKREVAE